ncbi:MAG: sterol desaturase [Pseudomonadales bacterium]|nr:sterol desaturase [Pseudomonadales bacterium]
MFDIQAIMESISIHSANQVMSALLFSLMLGLLCYEFFSGRLSGGRRTLMDWKMSGISFAMVGLVQRPLVFGACYLLLAMLLPNGLGGVREFSQEYFWWCLLGFLAIDEFLHGGTHYFSHMKSPKNKSLAAIQRFIKRAHRPHHLHGGVDSKGEISAAHAPVQHWAFLFILPNYWFGALVLYMGFVEVFFVGTFIKTAWVFHVHTNWNYDLYFLNHKNKYVRKAMYGLCHIFTFPTQHHQHHSRSKNSAKNMQNFFAIYDWLFWNTLVIENERPKIYGWRQAPAESESALFRYFSNK